MIKRPQGNAFDRAFPRILTSAFGSAPPIQTLYHYTTSAGALGIIKNNCLWLGDCNLMNDAQDGRYGARLIDEAIKRVIAEAELSSPAREVLDRFLSRPSHPFMAVFCLCERDNLLEQWREYGRDIVPYSLGLDPSRLAYQSESAFELHLARVNYDAETHLTLANTTAMYVVAALREIEVEEGAEALAGQEDSIRWLVSRLSMWMKHPDFAAEKEWRLFVDVGEPKKLHFRDTVLGIVPYYVWEPPTDQTLPIVSVTVGPTGEGEMKAGYMSLFLQRQGHQNVRVTHSGASVRQVR